MSSAEIPIRAFAQAKALVLEWEIDGGIEIVSGKKC